VGGARLRFFPDDDAALVLPWWVPERDREVLLALFQQVIADDLLVRVEVDWDEGLTAQDMAFLASERRRHGAEDRMVVVRVRREGVDLHQVLGLPEIRSFRRVAVVCEQMATNETVGVLLELGRVATMAAEERYDQLADELTLAADARVVLAPVLQRLQNPIDMVECFNELIAAQNRQVPEATQQEAVIAHTLKRLLRALPRAEALVLMMLAVGRQVGSPALIGPEQRRRLRGRMLLRDDAPAGWGIWLSEPRFIDIMSSALEESQRAIQDDRSTMSQISHEADTFLADVQRRLKPPP